ncbi:fimbrial protein FaeI [Escherichia coli]|nr:fimbrial protein FaeI [Escherichia coli]
MKKITLLLLIASLLPSVVLDWNTPGEEFSEELKLEGPVTSIRTPRVWKVEGRQAFSILGGHTISLTTARLGLQPSVIWLHISLPPVLYPRAGV